MTIDKSKTTRDSFQGRRAGCDWASVLVAFCRGTGLSELACYRVLVTAMDVAAGRSNFALSFVNFGKRMAPGTLKSDEAYQAMTSRDVATLERAEARSGFYPLVVTRGDKRKHLVSTWDFPGLSWFEQIHFLAVELIKAERGKPQSQRKNRKACFDAAFSEIEATIPRQQPLAIDRAKSTDPRDRRHNFIRSICGLTKRVLAEAISEGASEEEVTKLRDLITQQVFRVSRLSPEILLHVTSLKLSPLPPAPSVYTRGDMLHADKCDQPQRDSCKGDKNVCPGSQEDSKTGQESGEIGQGMIVDAREARTALDYLSSIGANEFAVLFVDDRAPKDISLQDSFKYHLNALREHLEGLLQAALSDHLSFIVDVRPSRKRLIQVDECNEAALTLLAPLSVLQILTSDGNGQSILVLPDAISSAEFEEIKRQIYRALEPFGANRGASGASRWPGSTNFKPNRRRSDGSFPRVRLIGGLSGRIVTCQDLRDKGLLTLPKRLDDPRTRIAVRQSRTGGWPEYDYTLAATDRSAADFRFCLAAFRMGQAQLAIEGKLRQLSDKAQQRSDGYVSRTVRNAIEAVENRVR